jgi:hypothetical protein
VVAKIEASEKIKIKKLNGLIKSNMFEKMVIITGSCSCRIRSQSPLAYAVASECCRR